MYTNNVSVLVTPFCTIISVSWTLKSIRNGIPFFWPSRSSFQDEICISDWNYSKKRTLSTLLGISSSQQYCNPKPSTYSLQYHHFRDMCITIEYIVINQQRYCGCSSKGNFRQVVHRSLKSSLPTTPPMPSRRAAHPALVCRWNLCGFVGQGTHQFVVISHHDSRSFSFVRAVRPRLELLANGESLWTVNHEFSNRINQTKW